MSRLSKPLEIVVVEIISKILIIVIIFKALLRAGAAAEKARRRSGSSSSWEMKRREYLPLARAEREATSKWQRKDEDAKMQKVSKRSSRKNFCVCVCVVYGLC